MSDLITSPTRLSFPRLRNPVAVKELRSRMRGSRAFWLLTLYLIALSGIVSLVYFSVSAAGASAGPGARTAGKAVFTVVVILQTFIVLFLTPAFTAGAIVGEKERQTYDILRTTALPARSLVAGKLVSALAFGFLLIGAAIPLESIAFLLGGISAVELLASQAMLLVGTVFYALLGLYFSSLMRSTLSASISTVGFVLLFTFGVPFGVLLLVSILGPILFATTPPFLVQAVLVYAGLFLVATNLPGSFAVSELLLAEEGAALVARLPLDGGAVWVVSPWLLFLLLHALLSVALFLLTVRRVRRIAER